jgi:hypothetical protein
MIKMKSLKFFAAALAIAAAATGCDKDDSGSLQQPEPAAPSGTIDWSRVKLNVGVNIAAPAGTDGASETRAAKQQWQYGDRIVAFLGTDDEEGTGTDYVLLEYTYEDGYKWKIIENLSSVRTDIAPTGRLTVLHAGNNADYDNGDGFSFDGTEITGVKGELLFTAAPAAGAYLWDGEGENMTFSITLSRGVSTMIKVINNAPAIEENMKWRLTGRSILVQAGYIINPSDFVSDPAEALRELFVPPHPDPNMPGMAAPAYRNGADYTDNNEVWFNVVYNDDYADAGEVELQIFREEGVQRTDSYFHRIPVQELNRPGSVVTIPEGPGMSNEDGGQLWIKQHELRHAGNGTYVEENGTGRYRITLQTDNTPDAEEFTIQAELLANLDDFNDYGEYDGIILPAYVYEVVSGNGTPAAGQALVQVGTDEAFSGTVYVSFYESYDGAGTTYGSNIVFDLLLEDYRNWRGIYNGPLTFEMPDSPEPEPDPAP